MSASHQELESLYRRFAPAVHRRALAFLNNEQEALDVTQDTFLAYLRGAARLRGDAQPFTVLFQIATYQSLARLRRRARWRSVLQPLAAPEGDDEGGWPEPAAPSDGAARVEAAQDLALLTRGEDPETLTVAALYYVEGCTTQEIAATLDLSRKTVGRLLVQFSARATKRARRLSPGAFQ